MNVRCPQCQSVYRVDPERVPVAGVRARCTRCSTVFAVSRSGTTAAQVRSAPAAIPEARPAPSAAPSFAGPAPAPPAPPAPRPIPPMPSAPPAAAPASPPSARPSFLKQDPNTRAQRLARALVSDIVAYNRDRRDQMLAAGTLKNEFREEIRKSWEEYVAQVGLELARNTPFFRDALNEILAKGQQVF
ncbi:MAG: zinc-ribbon domain-containing protein [Longimicrobiales bacterium]